MTEQSQVMLKLLFKAQAVADQAAVAAAEDKMENKDNLKRSLCQEIVYSEIGNGCKMCGMPINENEVFCSNSCKIKYAKIHSLVKTQ